jgi:hypothetical protein
MIVLITERYTPLQLVASAFLVQELHGLQQTAGDIGIRCRPRILYKLTLCM